MKVPFALSVCFIITGGGLKELIDWSSADNNRVRSQTESESVNYRFTAGM